MQLLGSRKHQTQLELEPNIRGLLLHSWNHSPYARHLLKMYNVSVRCCRNRWYFPLHSCHSCSQSLATSVWITKSFRYLEWRCCTLQGSFPYISLTYIPYTLHTPYIGWWYIGYRCWPIVLEVGPSPKLREPSSGHGSSHNFGGEHRLQRLAMRIGNRTGEWRCIGEYASILTFFWNMLKKKGQPFSASKTSNWKKKCYTFSVAIPKSLKRHASLFDISHWSFTVTMADLTKGDKGGKSRATSAAVLS